MPDLLPPIEHFSMLTVNSGSPHGRSIPYPYDLPGHNVFKGWSTWANSRPRKAVGDALDLFAPAGTPVIAIADLTQTEWRNDTQKTEVIYLEGGGITAVYAHINATHEGTGIPIKAGEVVGHLRGDLNHPHLHWELWLDGAAVTAATPDRLQAKMWGLFEVPPADRFHLVGIDGEPRQGAPVWMGDNGHGYGGLAAIAEACGCDVAWDGATKTWTLKPKAGGGPQ